MRESESCGTGVHLGSNDDKEKAGRSRRSGTIMSSMEGELKRECVTIVSENGRLGRMGGECGPFRRLGNFANRCQGEGGDKIFWLTVLSQITTPLYSSFS